jgi:hypothetical protein
MISCEIIFRQLLSAAERGQTRARFSITGEKREEMFNRDIAKSRNLLRLTGGGYKS